MNRKHTVTDSHLNAYRDTLVLARQRIIMLGGDGTDDKVQAGTLTIINATIESIDVLRNSKSSEDAS
jgi:hypothetical protein